MKNEKDVRVGLAVKLDKGAFMPDRAHVDDAGADLKCPVYTVVPAHGEAQIDFGVHILIPSGYYGKLESKSGLNFNGHIDIPGGIIDAGYTGSIKTVANNRGDKDYIFNAGDKVCQIIIQPCEVMPFYQVEELIETERGDSGFGSTGK